MTAPLLRRYLDLLKASLLGEIYLENELRLLHIYVCLATGQALDPDVVRNIGERMPEWVAWVRAQREDGHPWWWATLEVDGRRTTQNFRNICAGWTRRRWHVYWSRG